MNTEPNVSPGSLEKSSSVKILISLLMLCLASNREAFAREVRDDVRRTCLIDMQLPRSAAFITCADLPGTVIPGNRTNCIIGTSCEHSRVLSLADSDRSSMYIRDPIQTKHQIYTKKSAASAALFLRSITNDLYHLRIDESIYPSPR
jgi:hypothetical protein